MNRGEFTGVEEGGVELGKAWKRRGSGGCASGGSWEGRKGNVPSLTAHVTDRNRKRERLPFHWEGLTYIKSAQE